MDSPWDYVPSMMPEYGVHIFVLTLVLLIVGWIASNFAASKNHWVALLAFIPVTNPIALVILITKKNAYSLVPVVFYALACIIWFGGSRLMNQKEQNRLNIYIDQLTAQGEPTTGQAYQKPIVAPDLNVWHHPFLSGFLKASQQELSISGTKEISLPTRNKLTFPTSSAYVRDETQDPDQHPITTPFRTINEYAVKFTLEVNGGNHETENLPTTPEASAAILEDVIGSMQKDLTELSEAAFRPDHYLPRNWEDGYHILLPELPELKRFNQIASLNCIYHLIRGEPEIAFENARLSFRLAQIAESDFLISHLVQMRQLTFTMEAINAAQTYHAWTDAQWQNLESMLNTFDFLARMPGGIRCERAIGFGTMKPMLSKSAPEVFEAWDRFLDPKLQRKRPSSYTKSLKEFFIHQFAQAFFAKNWRLCLEGHSRLIENLEHLYIQSRTTPWQKLLNEWPKQDYAWEKVGAFGRMLLPALDRTHTRAIESQIRIEIAKTSIALERYFLKHQSYPETLEALKEQFPSASVIDPISRNPWHYQLTQDGYKIYSVGLNGVDDNGMRQRNSTHNNEQPADDLLWIVGELTKHLPPVTLKVESETDIGLDPEMMKRYGLTPIELEESIVIIYGEDK